MRCVAEEGLKRDGWSTYSRIAAKGNPRADALVALPAARPPSSAIESSERLLARVNDPRSNTHAQ
jgi:hypothetical protein